MTFISVFGIRDMIRDEVPSAITTVKRAGVNVIMCTGDNLLTARQIAREANILTDFSK
jgi:P-type E1-E2 ATPase